MHSETTSQIRAPPPGQLQNRLSSASKHGSDARGSDAFTTANAYGSDVFTKSNARGSDASTIPNAHGSDAFTMR